MTIKCLLCIPALIVAGCGCLRSLAMLGGFLWGQGANKARSLIVIAVLWTILWLPVIVYGAHNAETVWEIDSSGASTGGAGYYNIDPGTSVDYSQQDAAQASDTDLACADHVTPFVCTSAAGKFTAAMAGNVMQITDTGAGAHFVVGWYQVTVYTDANTIELDRDPTDGTNETAGDWYLGGSLDCFSDAFFEQQAAGNTNYLQAGTYTPGAAIEVAKDGAALVPLCLVGYNSSRGDYPEETDRPLIVMAANALFFDDYWRLSNFRLTTDHADGLKTSNRCTVTNIKVTGTSTDGFSTDAYYTKYDNVEVSGTTYGIDSSSLYTVLVSHSYFHDLTTGIQVGSNAVIWSCIFDTCSGDALYFANNKDNCLVFNNTFYSNGYALRGVTTYNVSIVNNILDNNTVGVSWTNSVVPQMDYNVWDNDTDTAGASVVKGPHAVNGDPGLTDPANGDFTLGSGSNAIDAGMQVGTVTGAVGDYKVNIGACQDDVAAGGSGGGTGFWTIQ